MWHTLHNVEFLQRRWDHDLVVYNAVSGDTHLLESMSAEIFIYLQQHSTTIAEIVEHIANQFHYEIDTGLEQHISGLLVKLEKLRLIESTKQ